jgi:hypothetical protein
MFSDLTSPKLEFKDWVITDFDDHLKGNIAVLEDLDLVRQRNE